MTREDIIRMAREADSYAGKHGPSAWRHPDEFAAFRDERFATLVAAAAKAEEREACAKVCEELHPGLATRRAAEIIRARSNT